MPNPTIKNPRRASKRKTTKPRVADNAAMAAKRVKTRPNMGFTNEKKINGDPNETFPLLSAPICWIISWEDAW